MKIQLLPAPRTPHSPSSSIHLAQAEAFHNRHPPSQGRSGRLASQLWAVARVWHTPLPSILGPSRSQRARLPWPWTLGRATPTRLQPIPHYISLALPILHQAILAPRLPVIEVQWPSAVIILAVPPPSKIRAQGLGLALGVHCPSVYPQDHRPGPQTDSREPWPLDPRYRCRRRRRPQHIPPRGRKSAERSAILFSRIIIKALGRNTSLTRSWELNLAGHRPTTALPPVESICGHVPGAKSTLASQLG